MANGRLLGVEEGHRQTAERLERPLGAVAALVVIRPVVGLEHGEHATVRPFEPHDTRRLLAQPSERDRPALQPTGALCLGGGEPRPQRRDLGGRVGRGRSLIRRLQLGDARPGAGEVRPQRGDGVGRLWLVGALAALSLGIVMATLPIGGRPTMTSSFVSDRRSSPSQPGPHRPAAASRTIRTMTVCDSASVSTASCWRPSV
jgi:hypothetical protein